MSADLNLAEYLWAITDYVMSVIISKLLFWDVCSKLFLEVCCCATWSYP